MALTMKGGVPLIKTTSAVPSRRGDKTHCLLDDHLDTCSSLIIPGSGAARSFSMVASRSRILVIIIIITITVKPLIDLGVLGSLINGVIEISQKAPAGEPTTDLEHNIIETSHRHHDGLYCNGKLKARNTRTKATH